jgi:hypothetical protein
MTRRTGPTLAALAWAGTVVVATAVGMSAVGAIGSGILGAGQEPLTPDQVDQALVAARSAPPPASAPVPSSTSAAPPPTSPEVITSPGGTIIARCADGPPEVVSATPAQGFRLHEEHEGSEVRFRSRESEVEVELTCENGRAVGAVEIDD